MCRLKGAFFQQWLTLLELIKAAGEGAEMHVMTDAMKYCLRW